MSSFQPNVPSGSISLNVDYLNLLGNNQQLDISFGIDHYPFSNATANNGFHNHVTTPLVVGGVHPTTTTNPLFYGLTETQVGSTLPIGLIQYSKGPSNAPASPVTFLQSTSAPIVLATGATTNVMDFTGLNVCMAKLIAFNSANPIGTIFFEADIFYGPLLVAPFFISKIVLVVGSGATFFPQFSGNILQIKNSSANLSSVYWTMQLYRTS